MRKPFSLGLVAAIGVAAMMTACGGGDNFTPPSATSQVPDSASQSIGGFIAYLQALVATPESTTNTLEPVDTSMVTPPTDETSEPLPVQ
ncbi:MAG: hypothetical protein M3Y55_07045 [Pseudomonadota bacterium]|nr:hypothetical protein [Pseudomonadota bacterium]MDQ2764818.1 hypothetical protein [Pseudomonadota bacterium]